MMKTKDLFWQNVRGLCILSVVLIHCLTGYSSESILSLSLLVVIRKVINFAVAIFIFLAGYFVNNTYVISKDFNYKQWIIEGGVRLLLPFLLWSLFYSVVSVLQSVLHGEQIQVVKLISRLIVGKSATPFYFIIVLLQLTAITPCLVKIILTGSKKFNIMLWILTPIYLTILYIWNYIFGIQPSLYGTLFPAWFLFYYLGLQVRCGLKWYCNGIAVICALLISCVEAFLLWKTGFSLNFYISQITFGSFLYDIMMIGWLFKLHDKFKKNICILIQLGDKSYGIFYLHMFVLMFVSKFVTLLKIDDWILASFIRFACTILISIFIINKLCNKLKKEKSDSKVLKALGFQ